MQFVHNIPSVLYLCSAVSIFSCISRILVFMNERFLTEMVAGFLVAGFLVQPFNLEEIGCKTCWLSLCLIYIPLN